MNSYFTVNTVIEIICFITSVYCLYKDSNPFWRSFIIYLLLVCLTETGGIYLRHIRVSNYSLYVGFLPFECLMVSSFLYYRFRKYNHRPILLYGWLVIFFGVYFFELWSSHFSAFPYRTVSFMSVVFVVASLYFYMLILKDEQFRNLSTYPAFWMVNGILFFYFGSTACNIFFDYLIQTDHSFVSVSVRYITFNILNILLYCCWSYAFICRYLQRKSSSLSH